MNGHAFHQHQLPLSTRSTSHETPALDALTIAQPALTHEKFSARFLDCARMRGELIAELSIVPTTSANCRALIKRITHLEHKLTTYIEKYEQVTGNKFIESSAFERARVAHDHAMYETLRKKFIVAGINHGESQGRSIDNQRLERSQGNIENLEKLTASYFSSRGSIGTDIPKELTGNQKNCTPLQLALRSAFRQGEKIGIENRIQAEVEAARIYRTIGGWKEYLPTWITLFKPFADICHCLQNKTRSNIGYIDQAFQERSGSNLFEGLVAAYGKERGARILWLLSGDQVATAAYSLACSLNSFLSNKHSRGEVARQIYEQIPHKEISRFEQALAHELKIMPASVTDYLAARITMADAQKLQALRSAEATKEKAIHLADILSRGVQDREEARVIFRQFKPQHVAALAEAYESYSGHSLRSAIETKLNPSAARDLCLAILDQDQLHIRAATIRCALDYKSEWSGAPFLRTTAHERELLIASYNQVYHANNKGDFWNDLRHACWRDDYRVFSHSPTLCRMFEKLWWPCTNSYPFIESLARNGELKPSELLRYFMVGLGTDVRGIYAVLSNRSAEEIAEITHNYNSRYTPGFFSRMIGKIPVLRNLCLLGDLRHDLQVELSGDHNFDISLFCEGLPNTADERTLCATMHDHLCRRYRYELGGVLMRVGKLTSKRGDRLILERLEKDFHEATEYYRLHIKDAHTLSPEVIKRFCTLARIAEVQADAYREAKVSLSTLILNSGAFIGATAFVMASVGIAHLSLWTVPVAAACGSLSWRWFYGHMLLGKGFGRTDATSQMVRALVDGASMLTARINFASLGRFFGTQISTGVVKSSVKTSLHRFIQTLEERIGYQDKARHLLEKGELLASDEELLAIHRNFLDQINHSSEAIRDGQSVFRARLTR